MTKVRVKPMWNRVQIFVWYETHPSRSVYPNGTPVYKVEALSRDMRAVGRFLWVEVNKIEPDKPTRFLLAVPYKDTLVSTRVAPSLRVSLS